MIDHDVQMRLLEIGAAAISAIGGSFGVLKAKYVLRSREATELAQIEYKKAVQRAELRAKIKLAKQTQLAEMVKTFNQNIQHLHILTNSLQTKLVDTAEKCASNQGKLELALPLLRHIVEMMPRFASAVEALDQKIEAAKAAARLHERPIPGSGGKVAIEVPKTPEKERKS